MKKRMKIYAFMIAALAVWIVFYASVVMAQSAEMPVTVRIVTAEESCAEFGTNCPVDVDPDTLNEIEPAAGVAEWTPEEQDMEHME